MKEFKRSKKVAAEIKAKLKEGEVLAAAQFKRTSVLRENIVSMLEEIFENDNCRPYNPQDHKPAEPEPEVSDEEEEK